MSRLFRRLSTLLLCSLLVLGVWLTQPLSVQAAEIRNKVDDKLAETAGKVDLNNASVRRFQQYPGMYPPWPARSWWAAPTTRLMTCSSSI